MRPARSPQGSSLPILPEPTDHLVRTDRRERCPHGIHAGSGVTTFSSTRPLHYRGVDGATSLSPGELFKDLPSRIIHHDVDSVWHSTLHPLCWRKCVTHYTLMNRSPQALLTARYPGPPPIGRRPSVLRASYAREPSIISRSPEEDGIRRRVSPPGKLLTHWVTRDPSESAQRCGC